MDSTKKLLTTSFIKKCYFAIISFTLTVTAYSQQSKNSDNWWAPIVEKHGIEFKTYTMRENYFFIIGEKTLDKGIEIFKNSTLISNGKDTYWIYKSKLAYYDTKNRTLKMDGCSIEQFDKNSKRIIPMSTMPCVNYLMNFVTNTEKVAFVPPADVVKK